MFLRRIVAHFIRSKARFVRLCYGFRTGVIALCIILCVMRWNVLHLDYVSRNARRKDVFVGRYNLTWYTQMTVPHESTEGTNISRNTSKRAQTLNYISKAEIAHTVSRSTLLRDFDVQYSTTNEIAFDYPEFNLTAPNFLSKFDEQQFWSQRNNKKVNGTHRYSGAIAFIPDGFASPQQDCGAFGVLETFRPRENRTGERVFTYHGALCPLLVPDGAFFQHFLDGVLPKIVQIYDFLVEFDVKLLLYEPRDMAIRDMLRSLHLDDRVVYYERNRYDSAQSSLQVNTCITPPLHPSLWKRGRQLLGGASKLKSRGYVIFISRRRTRNGGRRITNEAEIGSYLRLRYKDAFKLFSGALNFTRSVHLFREARIVIGVHGGALYNINFSPADTTVIEMMPSTPGGDVPGSLAHTMVWRMSKALDQNYWRMSAPRTNTLNDVFMPLKDLIAILDRV